MSTIGALNGIKKIPILPEDMGRGPWEFVCDKVKELVGAIGLVLFYSTIIFPAAYHGYKAYKNYHSFTPGPAQTFTKVLSPFVQKKSKNALSDKELNAMCDVLNGLLNTYITIVRNINGGDIDESTRQELNSRLGNDVKKYLKQYEISNASLGVTHPVFKEIMDRQLIDDLKAVGKDLNLLNPMVKEILFAYGFPEDKFEEVLDKFNKLPDN